jgi:predicted N-acetyltransferase YhbS
VRIAEQDGAIVGMATLSLRYQIGLGGLLGCLDELVIAPEAEEPRVNRALMQATVGKARSLGARRVVLHANECTPPPRAQALAQSA